MARHPVDIFSFLSGALFLVLGLLLLSGNLGGIPFEWAGPGVAIGLGMLILFAARGSRANAEPAQPAGDPGSADLA
jgi:hypothetical protein